MTLVRIRGSPPHTRGKSHVGGCNPQLFGITPAYAGKILSYPALMASKTDHPRIRGENVTDGGYITWERGSPPHTRGKFQCCLCQHRRPGITPAYAGKMAHTGSACPPPSDHPRIRGENMTDFSLFPALLGSPPHTRGKLSRKGGHQQGRRITPAYAGKIANPSALYDNGTDHPRIRGENSE